MKIKKMSAVKEFGMMPKFAKKPGMTMASAAKSLGMKPMKNSKVKVTKMSVTPRKARRAAY